MLAEVYAQAGVIRYSNCLSNLYLELVMAERGFFIKAFHL